MGDGQEAPSVKNDFALIAYALELMKNADGTGPYFPAMILDSIVRVRAMGIWQSFGKV